jgi:hypothetical protein
MNKKTFLSALAFVAVFANSGDYGFSGNNTRAGLNAPTRFNNEASLIDMGMSLEQNLASNQSNSMTDFDATKNTTNRFNIGPIIGELASSNQDVAARNGYEGSNHILSGHMSAPSLSSAMQMQQSNWSNQTIGNTAGSAIEDSTFAIGSAQVSELDESETNLRGDAASHIGDRNIHSKDNSRISHSVQAQNTGTQNATHDQD